MITETNLINIAARHNQSIPENAIECLGYEADDLMEETLANEGIDISQEMHDISDVLDELEDITYDKSAIDILDAAHKKDVCAWCNIFPAMVDLIKIWAVEQQGTDYDKIIRAIDAGVAGMQIAINSMTSKHLYSRKTAGTYIKKVILRHMEDVDKT